LVWVYKVNYYDGCNWLFISWYEESGWFVSCNLIGSISSDVIGWCYKTFQSVLGLRTKEEAAMLLIYILQNDTIVELVTLSMNAVLHKVYK
jgi:biotin transporter BioY